MDFYYFNFIYQDAKGFEHNYCLNNLIECSNKIFFYDYQLFIIFLEPIYIYLFLWLYIIDELS